MYTVSTIGNLCYGALLLTVWCKVQRDKQMTAITINLPESELSQIEQAATHLNRSTSDLVTDMVLASLPQVDGVPTEMKLELLQMTWADTPSLWQIAESQMLEEEQERMQVLVRQQAERELTSAEEAELDELRKQYGRATLRKAHAYKLLSLRGGQPVLNN